MGTDDDDVERLLASPAVVGGKTIWVSDQCVRRYRERRRSCGAPWQVQLQLRQLLETGRYRRSPPAWVPHDIAEFDGYVELKGGQELVGLAQDRAEPRTFRAVTWFERACLDWAVLPEDAPPRDGAIRVELSAHSVERYWQRVVRDGTPRAARSELAAIVQHGRLLPEVPGVVPSVAAAKSRPSGWSSTTGSSLPLQPSTRPAPDVFVATTCLYRGCARTRGCARSRRCCAPRSCASSRGAPSTRGRPAPSPSRMRQVHRSCGGSNVASRPRRG